MIYGYARVSSKDQIKGNSLEEQRQTLLAKGCVEVYLEQYTGKTFNRPIFNELKNKLKPGDVLMVTKLDRLARTVQDGITIIQDLINSDVDVMVLNIGPLNNTMMGRFLLTVLLAVAELERCMILERTQSGKEMARKKPGYREGRPRIPQAKIDAALDRISATKGYTYKQASIDFGIGMTTLYNAAAKRRIEAKNK